MSIRILLADDHQIVLDGLTSLLARDASMEVVGQALEGRTAVRMAAELSPDVIVMDISMPEMNGIEATRQILSANPRVRIIALSIHSDSRIAAKMLTAGAAGYLQKSCAFRELLQAIRTVSDDRTYLSPGVADIVTKDYVRRMSAGGFTSASLLTDREGEVLQLLAEGRSTKQIASMLHVSVKTVETHRRQIMRKLGVNSLAELIKYAVREGLTSIDL